MGLIDRIKRGVVAESLETEDKPANANGKTRLAVPSTWPGGLESLRSGHFGRCDCFTLVDIEQGQVRDVTIVPTPPHTQGSCLVPVNLLMLLGVNAIIVSDIGMRPLIEFREAGMEVYSGVGDNVSDVVLEFIVGVHEPMLPQQACGGH